MKKPRLTTKAIEALIQAAEAMLAGEEGEGDATGIAHEDLQRGSNWLKNLRDTRARRKS